MLRNSRLMMSLGLVTALASPVMAEPTDCPESAMRSRSIDADGVRQIFIEARAGSLTVEGSKEIMIVRAEGKACAHDEQLLEEIQLVVERRGRDIHIVTEIPNRDWSFWKQSPSLDLSVELPRNVKLIVEDGSGATIIRGVQELRLRDGSGAITVEDIDGNVEIEDGSGAISIDDVGGSLELEDGSGGLTIEDVRGTVRV